MLFKYAKEALPEIGLTSASGKISTGTLIKSNIGFKNDRIKSRNPLFIKRLIAKIIAIKVGNRLVIIEKLSLTPSMNVSYTSTFFIKP